ncbi:MAG TPA: hypothetical protein PK967_03130 [Candidatus Hydrogenedentes bacterium]|nr:hypothetical protein [Candidatus Hydrogenedentota bacterium]
MARIDGPVHRLTEYERAVCYYTLPRLVHPLTFGLMAIYTVCLFEAAAILVYGVASDQDAARNLGAAAMAAVIGMGVVTFTLRALLNEVRQRWALAGARGLTERAMNPDDSEAADIPDPFASHVLLRRPLPAPSDLYACTDNDGNVMYFVEMEPGGETWRIKDAQETDIIQVRAEAPPGSFFMEGQPARLSVCRGPDEVARIVRCFSLSSPKAHIQCWLPRPAKYSLVRDSIYREGTLVGRFYEIHQSLYLDIEKDSFHDAILGLFVTLS